MTVETKQGDLIDFTAQQAFQMKRLETGSGMDVVHHIHYAITQFGREVPPAGFERIIDIRIDNDANDLVGLSREQMIHDLKNQYLLNPQLLVNGGVDEIWIRTPNTKYMFTPEDFR